MIRIKNLHKIKGKELNSKYEVYDVYETNDEYVFQLSNIGQFKHFSWYMMLERTEAVGAMGGYRLYTNNNGSVFDWMLHETDITPDGIIKCINSIMGSIERENLMNQIKQL